MNKGKKSQKVETKADKFDPANYAKNGLTEDEVNEIKEAFDLFDSNKNGTIDTEELKNALKSLGIDAKNQTLTNMLNDLDKNGNNSIEFDEFIEMMTAKMSDKDTREDLKKVFYLFTGDESSDGINFNDLKRVANELNEQIKDDELREMISRADTNKDDKVSFEEFYTIMTKKI